MRKNDLSEIKNMDTKGISAKLISARAELADLILDKNMKTQKDIKLVLKKRHQIAQMMTIMNQKLSLEKMEVKS